MSATAAVHETETYTKTVFGFWVYLMTDCILFATLFATYAVLHNNTNGGPHANELFSLPYALTETLVLLASSFTSGLALIAIRRKEKIQVVMWLGVTFLLGAAFLGLELNEFYHLVKEGNSWQRNAFLSSFFTLVGTHGLHIIFGLLWIIVMIGQFWMKGISFATFRRLECFGLFWHFLDLIWIFIFTFVYLMGVK